MFAVVHEHAELGPAFAELVGDMAPGLPGTVLIGLQERLAQRGRSHGLLGLADMSQCIPHPMDSGAVEQPQAARAEAELATPIALCLASAATMASRPGRSRAPV